MALEPQTQSKHDQQPLQQQSHQQHQRQHQQKNQQHHHTQHQQQQQQQQQRQQFRQSQQRQQPQQQQLEASRTDEDDEPIEEIEPVPYRTTYDTVYEMAEKFAGTGIGQFVIRRCDKVLRTVELTAKWSLPEDKNSDAKLERPLSWLPFLMLIIALRLVRIWLSIAALMIGNGPVTPFDMVYFIQTRRRKLRSLRVHGLKEIQRRESERSTEKQNSESQHGLLKKLQNLLSTAICRPGHHREPARRIFIQYGQAVPMDKEPESRQVAKRPRDDEDADLNLTVEQMLSKYANQNSEDDSDFVPNPEDESSEDDDDAEETTSDASEESCKETENGQTKSHTNGDASSAEGKTTNAKHNNSKSENNNIVIAKKPNNEQDASSKMAENKQGSSSLEHESAREQHSAAGNENNRAKQQPEVDVANKKSRTMSKTQAPGESTAVAALQSASEIFQMHGPPAFNAQLFSSLGVSAGSPPDFNAYLERQALPAQDVIALPAPKGQALHADAVPSPPLEEARGATETDPHPPSNGDSRSGAQQLPIKHFSNHDHKYYTSHRYRNPRNRR